MYFSKDSVDQAHLAECAAYRAAQDTKESAQHIAQQTKAKITCCFCGSPCVRIRGESEWVKCSKCGELHRK